MWNLVRQKGILFWDAFSVGLPFLTFMVSAISYCVYTPELLKHHRWDESRLLFFVLTIIFGYITSRLIVQRVCKEPAPVMYPIVVPIALAGAHAVLHAKLGVPHYVDPHVVLKGIAVVSLVQVAAFFYALNKELTSYLGIKTFSIPIVTEEVTGAPKQGWKKKRKTTATAKETKQTRGRSRSRSPRTKKNENKEASPRRTSPRTRSSSRKTK